MVMKKLTGILGKRSSHDEGSIPNGDSPEAAASRAVRLFCESGGPSNATEEIQYLPEIVTNAESSPPAAAAAAHQIRKFLSKDNYNRPHVQYNAVMLIRILADNPGASFTQNLDKKFTETVKELLRNGRDPSVQQILRETLNAMYREKAYDNNLSTLFQMWDREQGGYAQPRNTNGQPQPRPLDAPAWSDYQPPRNTFARHPSHESYASPNQRQEPGLPPPAELAARIEEARTSAKLLLQLVQSSGPGELLSNDLVKEFAERCQSAQRSMQTYMNCENPPPDDETMQTLIETSEQLSLATSKHQRAVLNERRAIGAAASSQPAAAMGFYNNHTAPREPPLAPPRPGPPPPGSTLFAPENRQQTNTYNPPSGPPAPAVYTPPRGPPPPPLTTQGGHPPTTIIYTPTSPSDSLYSPPPVPPPSMQSKLQRRASPTETQRETQTPMPMATGPVAHIPTEPVELPSPTYANPFDDENEHHPQPAEPFQPQTQWQEEGQAVPSMAAAAAPPNDGVQPPSPGKARLVDIPPVRRKEVTGGAGSPNSYHPGFNSTQSYVRRQESAVGGLTMRGALSEEEDGERRVRDV